MELPSTTKLGTLEQAQDIMWSALWAHAQKLEDSEANARYRTGRAKMLDEQAMTLRMLRGINSFARIVPPDAFKDMCADFSADIDREMGLGHSS
jgi:hypothetical protein